MTNLYLHNLHKVARLEGDGESHGWDAVVRMAVIPYVRAKGKENFARLPDEQKRAERQTDELRTDPDTLAEAD